MTTLAIAPGTKRIAVRLMLVLALLAVLAISGSTPAAASTGSGAPSNTAACPADFNSGASEDILLPVNRWSDGASQFHSRTSSGLLDTSFLREMNRDMLAGTMLTLGNNLWGVTSDLSEWATRFCIMDTAGTTVDSQVGGLVADYLLTGEGLVILVAILALVIVYTVYTSWRRGRLMWGPFVSKAMVVALLGAMGLGASSTNVEAGTFGTGSPGWIITNVNNTITSLASAPTIGTARSAASMPSGPDVMSCETYRDQLLNLYQDRYDTSILRTQTAMPILLNSIWETTGLEAWKQAQFGINSHADMIYCRALDEFAGIPVGSMTFEDDHGLGGGDDANRYIRDRAAARLAVMSHYWDGPAPVAEAIAFRPVNDITRDVSLVAWASCQPSGNGWTYRGQDLIADDSVDANHDGSQVRRGPENEGGQGCAGWWTEQAVAGSGGFNDGSSAFNWSTDLDNIYAAAADADAAGFLLSMRAANHHNATGSAFFYLLSAVAMFVVFGALSLVIVASKFILVALMLVSVIVMVASLLPRANVSERLGSVGKQLLGVILLSTLAVFLFAVIGMFTRVMVEAGNSVFATGGAMSMMWAALSPVLAVATLHWIFKRVLKVQSPFSMRGAMAWGAGSAAIGGAVGGMVGGGIANRIANRASQGVKNTGRRAASGAMNKVTGGRAGGGVSRRGLVAPRRKGMAPDDQRTTKAGAGLAAGGGKFNADGTKKSRHELRTERGDREEQLLRDSGMNHLNIDGADPRERKQALKQARKDQIAQVRTLTKDKWAQRNGDSIRASIARRRQHTPAGATDLKDRRKLALRDVTGGVKDWGKGKVADRRAAMAEMVTQLRRAPLRTIGSAAGKTIKTGGIVAGGVLAAGLVPGAAPVMAGAYLARKAYKSNAVQRNLERFGNRLGGHRYAADKLAAHKQAHQDRTGRQSASQPDQRTGEVGSPAASGGERPAPTWADTAPAKQPGSQRVDSAAASSSASGSRPASSTVPKARNEKADRLTTKQTPPRQPARTDPNRERTPK